MPFRSPYSLQQTSHPHAFTPIARTSCTQSRFPCVMINDSAHAHNSEVSTQTLQLALSNDTKPAHLTALRQLSPHRFDSVIVARDPRISADTIPRKITHEVAHKRSHATHIIPVISHLSLLPLSLASWSMEVLRYASSASSPVVLAPQAATISCARSWRCPLVAFHSILHPTPQRSAHLPTFSTLSALSSTHSTHTLQPTHFNPLAPIT
jgi:hypothetical protein